MDIKDYFVIKYNEEKKHKRLALDHNIAYTLTEILKINELC